MERAALRASVRFGCLIGGLWLACCAVGHDVDDESVSQASLFERGLLPTATATGTGLVPTGLPSATGTGPAATVPAPTGSATAPAPTATSPAATATGVPTGMPGVMPFGMGMPGASAADAFIDDLEDGDETIAALAGRSGAWFLFNDGSANQTFAIEACDRPSGASACAHSNVSNVPEYAGFGFSLLANEAPYDASAYRGVRFAAKNTMAGAVTVSIVTGASAAADGVPGFEAQAQIGPNWRDFEVTFAELELASWYTGPRVAFDAAELVKVQFMTGAGTSHDIFVDDLEFF
jgi:hypothetical protein